LNDAARKALALSMPASGAVIIVLRCLGYVPLPHPYPLSLVIAVLTAFSGPAVWRRVAAVDAVVSAVLVWLDPAPSAVYAAGALLGMEDVVSAVSCFAPMASSLVGFAYSRDVMSVLPAIPSATAVALTLLVLMRRVRVTYEVVRAERLKYAMYVELTAAGIFAAVAAVGMMYLMIPSPFATVSAAILITYGLAGVAYFVHRALSTPSELRVQPYRRDFWTAFVVRRERLYAFAVAYASKIAELVRRAGVKANPILLACKYVTASVLIAAMAPVTLPLTLVNPVLAVAAAVSVLAVAGIALLFPIIVLSSKAGDRRRRVEEELPWFALLATVAQHAGVPLHEAMLMVLERPDLFPAMKDEALNVRKKIEVMGRDAVSALEELAEDHPSRRFRRFIRGYTSLLRTGGDLTAYLESRLREYLRDLGFRLREYGQKALTLVEVSTIVYLVMMSALVFGGAAGSAASAGVLALFAAVVCPAVAAVMYAVAHITQPKFRDRVGANHVVAAFTVLTAGIAALIAVLRGLGDPATAVLAITAALGFGYGLQFHAALRRIRREEDALPDFVRDVAELRKVGYTPARAIKQIARSRKYDGPLDDVVKSLASQVSFNVPLSVTRVPSGSWLVQTVTWILGKIEDTGGGTPRTLELITDFLEDVQQARKHMVSSLKVYDVLTSATPIILVAVTSMAAAFIGIIAPATRSSAIPFLQFGNVNWTVVKAAVVSASVASAFVAGKVVDGTVKSLLRLLIVSLVTLAAITWLQPWLTNLFVTQLTGTG